ncbi:MAG: hypothetical protein H7251_17015, partial [Acetobacteraceae bacterium]|nr:hypothetical protein [Acetobacteraceae bacterium]
MRSREQARGMLAPLQTQLAATQVSAGQVPELKSTLEAVQTRLNGMEAQFAARTATLAAQEADRDDLRKRLAAAEAILRQKADLEATHAALRETLQQERRQSAEKLAQLQDVRDEMTKEFKLAASSIMQQHGETFTKQN